MIHIEPYISNFQVINFQCINLVDIIVLKAQ